MRQLSLFFLILFGTAATLNAQPGWYLKENANWVFYERNGLSFLPTVAGGSSRVTTRPASPWGSESAAAVSDINGHLLFYTNTDSIWDRNGNVMPNGVIGGGPIYLTGDSSFACGTPDPNGSLAENAPQSVLILPVLNNPNQYYVFCLNGYMNACCFWDPGGHKLLYSIVDMSLNDGLGDVVPGMKNLMVDSALGGMMTAVPGNDCNIWLLVHDRDTTIYKAFEISTSGIGVIPVISNTGSTVGLWYNKWGEMQVSPDRQKLVYINVNGLVGNDKVELNNFDPNTGMVSGTQTLIIGDTFVLPTSAVFSPDNSRLYVSFLQNSISAYGGAICQFDLSLSTTAAISNSVMIVSTPINIGDIGVPPSQIRLGYDGRIYSSISALDTVSTTPVLLAPWLGTIDNPNTLGLSCGFNAKGIILPPMTEGVDTIFYPPFPYVIGNSTAFVKPLSPDTIYSTKDTVICSNQDSLLLKPQPGNFWFQWEDGSRDSIHVIKTAGTYWVKNSNYCQYHIDTFVVKAVDIDIDLGTDTTICDSVFMLQADIPGATYLWNDSSTASSLLAGTSGNYSVTVSNQGCRNRDSINLYLINIRQDLGADIALCKGDPIDILLKAKLSSEAITRWSNGSNQPEMQVTDTGKYWVHVTEAPCSGSDTISISQEWCDCTLLIPSAFSPNGDGLNDRFTPVPQDPACFDIGNYTLDIYNRWGQRIFSGQSQTEGWNGLINGKAADMGSYTYIIKYNLGKKGKDHIKRGTITLIK